MCTARARLETGDETLAVATMQKCGNPKQRPSRFNRLLFASQTQLSLAFYVYSHILYEQLNFNILVGKNEFHLFLPKDKKILQVAIFC